MVLPRSLPPMNYYSIYLPDTVPQTRDQICADTNSHILPAPTPPDSLLPQSPRSVPTSTSLSFTVVHHSTLERCLLHRDIHGWKVWHKPSCHLEPRSRLAFRSPSFRKAVRHLGRHEHQSARSGSRFRGRG